MRWRFLASACLCGLLASLAPAAAPPPAPDGPYSKKATWQETLLAAREALVRLEAQDNAAAQRDADPALKAFQPFSLTLTAAEKPEPIKVRIAGLRKLYVGARGPTEVYVGDPRLADRDGKATPLHVGKARMLGKNWVQHDEQPDWKARKLGDRMLERGFRLRDTELVLELDGSAEWLEAWVACRQTGGQESLRVWADCRSVLEREERGAKPRDSLWERVRQDFPDLCWDCERKLERAAGIWDPDVKAGQLGDLARRYAAACKGPLRDRALKMAEAAQTEADLQRVRDCFYAPHAEARLAFAKKTLALVAQASSLCSTGKMPVPPAAPRPQLAAELQAIEKRLEGGTPSGAQAIYTELRLLRRRIILSHPLLDFEKLLINKRTCEVPGHMCDQYLGRHSRPGPGLAVLASWKDQPKETLLLAGKLPAGMTYHPDLSGDASRVAFAFCDHTERDSKLRGFSLYETSIDGSQFRQLTGGPSDPRVGAQGRQTVLVEDFDPCYLPDGGLAFISTRSQQFGRCHGGRYVPSYILYRADADGSNIRQLSFNEAHEWNPSVLPDGRIIYTRWDYINRHDTVYQSLWVMRPDGTATGHFYGNNSRSPCMIAEAKAIPGSAKVVATGTDHHGYTAGTILVIDPRKGDDEGPPLLCVTPEFPSPEGNLPRDAINAAQPLPDDIPRPIASRVLMRAATPFPITEDLFLVAYPHETQYAIYLVDTLGGRELIYYDPAISCFDPIPVRPTPTPAALPSFVAHTRYKPTGQFYVQDVYRSTQPLERGSIKRLRVNEIISQPASSKPVLSAVENEILKRVVGTVPVNGDGSVAFEAPASTPLQFQLLDANGMAVMTMRSLVYLQPGEQVSCVGCHEPRYDAPALTGGTGFQPVRHGQDARATAWSSLRFHRLEPSPGPQGVEALSFARTVQPVLDRYCISCHGLDKTEGNVNLLGTFADQEAGDRKRTGPFTASYASLTRGNLVRLAHRNSESVPSKPKDYFAHAGKLARMLLDGHRDKEGKPRVALDRNSFQRIIVWLDLNCQFYGDYSFNRIETQKPAIEGEKALREAIEKRFGGELAGQPFAALANIAQPSESRVLMAPLPEGAGGWGQIAKGAFTGADDPARQELARLVQAALPVRKCEDIAGTCGSTPENKRGCNCGCCWVRLAREPKAPPKTAQAPTTR